MSDLPALGRPIPAPPAAQPTGGVRAPMMRGFPIIGSSWHMRQDPLPYMLREFEASGSDAQFMRLGPYKATIFRNPEHVKRIFVDNHANYGKQTRGYIKARIVLGEGLVTSEGELWQRQRRIATPAFHRQRVAAFATVMTEGTAHMLSDWRQRSAADPTPTIDVFSEMMRLTLRIALQTLLGTSAEREIDELSPAVTESLERTNDIITNPLSLPEWVPTPKHRRFRKAIQTLDQFVFATIARRRAEQQEGRETNDLLSMLLAARDEETGQGMSDRQLRDEAVTILIAGHETTANVLAWALWLLAMHPGERALLEAEVDASLGSRVPAFDDLPKLPRTRAVVEETMRLYPPAWMIGRSAKADDQIGPYLIRGGEFVLVSPYVIHRHPGLWNDPSRFDPARFIDGRSAALPKFSYLPFGGGQRFCIGSNFAMMEATFILAMLTQATRLEALPTPVVVPWAMITLRPKNGIGAKVHWRDSPATA